METAVKSNPIAEAMIAFINGEQSLYSIQTVETNEDRELARIIYRLCDNWVESRRRMISSTDSIVKQAKNLQEQLLANVYRTDGTTWIASPFADLEKHSEKTEMFASHIVSLAKVINLSNDNLIKLFEILGNKATTNQSII